MSIFFKIIKNFIFKCYNSFGDVMKDYYTIEKLDHQGRGIIHVNGKVIFVENALPNEIVEIQIVKSKKNFAEAKVLSYEKKSEYRCEALCPYYEKCGGCHMMHVSYEKQLMFKLEKVKDILNKFMKNFTFAIQPVIEAEHLGYRNKATFQIHDQIGYFKKESNTVVPIQECLLVDVKINKILKLLSQLDVSMCQQIIVRASKFLKETMVIFITDDTIEKEKIIETIGKYVDSIYVKGKQLKCIYGKSYIEEKLGDFIFEISPDSFFQVNSAQAKNLYDLVKKYANLKKTDSVLDLYCGTGTIGLYVSPYVHKVLGIEVNEQAIMDAKRNQKKNCIENVAFICGNVSQMLSTIKEYYDVIIVDPPRSGLDKETIRFLKSCGAKRIIYVSCDPVTLARDLNILSEVYGVLELTPVDMFPNTYHVECVCVLNRR